RLGVALGPAISADGRFVAFSSTGGLTPGAELGVFVFDRLTRTIEHIPSGGLPNRTEGPALSADGRIMAFVSRAANLVPRDTNGGQDMFVFDRQMGTTERVSVSAAGDQAQGSRGSFSPSISSDGRFVAFVSDATNLVAGDTNNAPDVFVHDRQTGATELISVN